MRLKPSMLTIMEFALICVLVTFGLATMLYGLGGGALKAWQWLTG